MKRQSASMPAMVMALVAVGTVLLAVYPSAAMAQGYYDCKWNKDHNGNTISRINCYDNPDAATLSGCQTECDNYYGCNGVVWIPNQYGWKDGVLCCFLKKKIGKLQSQANRVTCKK